MTSVQNRLREPRKSDECPRFGDECCRWIKIYIICLFCTWILIISFIKVIIFLCLKYYYNRYIILITHRIWIVFYIKAFFIFNLIFMLNIVSIICICCFIFSHSNNCIINMTVLPCTPPPSPPVGWGYRTKIF